MAIGWFALPYSYLPCSLLPGRWLPWWRPSGWSRTPPSHAVPPASPPSTSDQTEDPRRSQTGRSTAVSSARTVRRARSTLRLQRETSRTLKRAAITLHYTTLHFGYSYGKQFTVNWPILTPTSEHYIHQLCWNSATGSIGVTICTPTYQPNNHSCADGNTNTANY